MSNLTIVRLTICLCIALGYADLLRADLIIQFSDDSGNSFSDTYQVAPGDTLSLDVFLSDTDGATGVLNTEGLVGLGLAGDVQVGNSGSIVAASRDPVFDTPIDADSFTATSVRWNAGALFNTIPTGISIHLGSFDFHASSVGTTTFAWSDIQPGGGSGDVNWLSGTGAELDETIFGIGATNTFPMTINVVPEPSSYLVISLGLAVSLRRRRPAAAR